MKDFDNNTLSKLNQNKPTSLYQLYEDAIISSNLNGKYQKILFVILALVAFSCSMIVTGFPSQKEIPSYVCINRIDFEESTTDYIEYKSNPQRYKLIHEEQCVARYCSKEENFESAIFWVLIADYKSVRNFVTHLDVLCDLDYYSGSFTRWIFMGRIVTTIVFSYVSDTYGRRISWMIVLVLLAMSNLMFLLVSNKSFYLLIGFISNMCMSNYNLTMIISVEVMNIDLYSTFNGIVATLFAFCGLFTIFIMTTFKDWLVLVFIHLVIDISMIYFSYYYFAETPYFCLNKKKYDELNDVITHISKVNETYESVVKGKLENIDKLRKTFNVVKRKVITNTTPNSPEIISKRRLTVESRLSELSNLSLGEDDNKDNKNSSNSLLYDLFKPYMIIFYKRKQLMNLIKLTLPFITINFVYYGQLMFLERLPGDPKTNSFLIFLAEMFAPNLAGWLMQSIGRKKILYFFHACCIVLCLAIPHVENPFMATVLLFLNAFCICLCFVVSYVFAAEAFPTSIKTSANGLLILIGNFSLVVGDLLMNIFPSPFYLFALICLGSIFSITSMKETLKRSDGK